VDPDSAFHFNVDPDIGFKNNADPDPNPKPWVRNRTGGRQADESEIEEKCSPKEDRRQRELSYWVKVEIQVGMQAVRNEL
jgi:hypothetical protein